MLFTFLSFIPPYQFDKGGGYQFICFKNLINLFLVFCDFRSYLVATLANKIEELGERKEKDRHKAKIKESKDERVRKRREQLEQQFNIFLTLYNNTIYF